MAKDLLWRALSIDSISPEYFPKVALYLKNGSNYVLYKDPERVFTADDFRRLERNLAKFLYVRSGDIDVLNEHVESNLGEMLSREDLNSTAKSRILYQASVNCVIDMFESPEPSVNLLRCRNMVEHIMQFVSEDTHTMESLQTVIDCDFYIFAHVVQVTALSLLMHEKLFKLAPDEMNDVGIGSLMHDYGMTFISSAVLERKDALSDIEYWKVKQHTQKGYEYLKSGGNYSDIVLNIVRYHHERYDGNGYPTGIKGNEIPRSAQVAMICDVYSALVMDRPRRKANSHTDAIKIMRDEVKNGAFSPELFNYFERIVNERNGV